MGRFKKHFKGVCWKRKSSDSDVEDDSEKQKTPNGEPSSAKGKKKAAKPLKKGEPIERVIDLDFHVPKAVKDELDKLDRLGVLNMESINKFVGTLKFDRHKDVLRLIGECKDGKKEPKHKKVQHVSVNPDLVKNEPSISEIQSAQRNDVKQHADEGIPVLHHKVQLTMPYLQRDDMFSVTHDFPDEEPACVVNERVYVNNTLAKRSLREMGTLTDDIRVSVVSTCSGPDAPFPRERKNIFVTPVEMKSIACETEYPVESRKLWNPVMIDNCVKVVETKPSHTEMKSIAINTEEVDESTKTGQPFSGLPNPTKVWNMTPFNVYCKRVSVPEPEPLREGESPYRYLFARPASKSRLSKFNIKIPRAFSSVNTIHIVEEKSAEHFTTNSEGGSLIDKGGTDTTVVDVNGLAPHMFGLKPTSDDLQTSHQNELHKRRFPDPIHMPKLGMLCRKMFFDDTAHARNEAGCNIGSYKLSGLAMAYTNVAHQRFTVDAHSTSERNMMVMPLREMCRQLLGLGGLGKGNPIIDVNTGNGFGTITKQGYTAEGYRECFRPELKNAHMDEVDRHCLLDDLSVKGKFGDVGTSYEDLKFPQVQLMAVVPNVVGPEPLLINIQQLRLICTNMFFGELRHFLKQDKSAAGSYKLSDLSMAYLNAAYQRLKTGTQYIGEGNMSIYPLREVCRQLLCIVLSKHGPLNGLNMGNGCDLEVRPDVVKDVGGMVYFGPELPIADPNEVDSILAPRYGATVTSDGDQKDQQNELMAVVPYISRSEPMFGDLKAKYNCEVEKQRVVEPIHISQLRMLCRKVFFEDISHASNQAECAVTGYKLSGLALTYINAVQHRLKGGIHHIKEGNMMVPQLREMCRQLFGIGRLRIEGQFGDTPTSTENVGLPKRKLLDHADYAMTKAKQLSRIPKLVLPTVDKGLTAPVGPITLKYLMERYGASGTFKESHVRFLSYNLLEGLKFLHRKGIAHKFVFPKRITINSNGYPSLMSDNEAVGPKIQPRIEFSSPELITSGPITMATDIFQVGLLAYSVMYGRSPYKATTYSETKTNLLDDYFTPQFENASMSRDGRYFIKKCLRKDPGMRFSFVKCRRSLEHVVNWFYEFKGEDLANQRYTSPFKDLVNISI